MLKGKDVERLLPGSMPFWYRRPWLFATLVAILILVAVVGGVVGFFMATDRPPFDDRGPAEESAAAAPVVVDDQTAVLAAVSAAFGGPWDPVVVRYYECENDNVKGWTRYATLSRTEGATPTADQLDALELDLGAHGFDDAYFSPPPAPSLAATSGEFDIDWRTVDVAVDDDGGVWAQVTSSCLVG